MNSQQSNALYEKFNSELTIIEKDMAEIAQMAASVSEKFSGIGENIQSFASIPGFGRKGMAAAHIIGGAVKLFGGLYADMKKEDALQKLLPKKVEIAESKTAAVKNFGTMLEGKREEFSSLLQQELSLEFTEEGRVKYQETQAEACQNSYSLYVRSMHIVEICNYMLAEFAAWKMGKHESGMANPDKAVVLGDVVTMITTPQSLSDPTNNKLTGGMYLLSKNEPLFATLIHKLHIDATATEKKKVKRVANRKSFTEVKKFTRQLKKIEQSKDVNHLDWLKSIPTFQQAVENSKLTSLFAYLFKFYGIGYFVFFLYVRSSMGFGAADVLFSSLVYSAIVSAIVAGISLLIFYIYEDEDAGRGMMYYGLFLAFTVLTFGLMPLAFKRYLKKEKNYENFLDQLKLKINE